MVELVLAMTSASVLMAGLGTTVLITSQALQPTTPAQTQLNSTEAAQRMLRDIRLATGFIERTDRSVTVSVPDRDGDGRQEVLRYAWSGTRGDPLLLTYNSLAPVPVSGGLEKFKLGFNTQQIAAVDLPAEQTGGQVVYLVNDSKSLSAEEASKKSMLESWNFVVGILGANDGKSKIERAVDIASVIYISPGFETSDNGLLNKIVRSRAGIITENSNYIDDLGFANDSDKALAFMINKDYSAGRHYITEETSNGNTTVTILPVLMSRLKGTLSPDVCVIATVSGKPALVSLNADSESFDGDSIPGRRVLLPWGDDLATQLLLNNNGLDLTRRAVEWASGIGPDAMQVKVFGYEQVFGTSFAQTNQQLATRVTLTEAGNLVAISAYVGGNIRPTRFAIYSDAGNRPGQLLAETNTSNTSIFMGWLTLDTPAITLPPGNYWLAVAFSGLGQSLRQGSANPAGLNANTSHNAVGSGFSPSWSPGSSAPGGRSIYALYEVLP